MEAALWEAITRLAPLSPRFVSVTYGAGGTTRERTHATVTRIIAETRLTPAAHLTCVAATGDEVNEVVRGYWAAGVRHIVALRGDPQGGLGTMFCAHPGGYENSDRARCRNPSHRRFRNIGLAPIQKSIPRAHRSMPTSMSCEAKVAAGATRAITQFFFENENYLRYVESRAPPRHQNPDRARHRADTKFQANCRFRQEDRRKCAAVAG